MSTSLSSSAEEQKQSGILTSSRCSVVELSVSLTGNAGPFEDAEDRCLVVDAPLGTLLDVEGPLPFLELICMTTLRT